MDLGSLKRALIVLKCRLPIIGNTITYVMNTDWETLLYLKIEYNLKKLIYTMIYFAKHCDINFHTYYSSNLRVLSRII